jgi:predicted Zn-dependent peptidase
MIFNVKNVAMLLFLMATMTLQAQQQFTDIQTLSDGEFEYVAIKNDPANARFYTLSNGLTVILAKNTEEPKVSTMIAVKAGSKHDPSDNTGLAHYLEHMLFKGTDQFGTKDYEQEKVYLEKIDSMYRVYNGITSPEERKRIYKGIDSLSTIASKFAIPNEYDKLMQMLGAEGTNAFTSFEQTVYINSIPSNQLSRWLTVEAERFRNPVLRLFHTELEAVYEEKNISMDNDNSKVFEQLLSGLFPTHPYGQQTTIGTVEHLKNPSLKAIRDYYHKYYRPNNMAIIMVGDLDFESTIREIHQRFSYMKPMEISQNFPTEKPLTAVQEFEVFGPSPEMLFMGFRMPGNGTKEADLLYMTDLILSNNAAGLIDINLNKSQKVLGAGCSPLVLNDYAVHYFYGGAKKDQTLEQVKALLLGEIEKVKKGDFDEDLLKAIIVNETLSEIKNFENNENLVYDLMTAFSSNMSWIDRINRPNRWSTITKQEIMDFANAFYKEQLVVVYKRQSTSFLSDKMEKPEITPLELNRDDESPFARMVREMPFNELEPVFFNPSTDIKLDRIGKVPFFHVPNQRNSLFDMYYVIDVGSNHDKTLSLALDYLEYLGTDSLSAQQISSSFYALGSTFSVYSGSRYSYISLSGLQSNFKESVQLFEYFLSHIKVDEEALLELKSRMLKSRENNLSSKFAIRNALNQWAYYGKQNPTTFILTNKELSKLTSGDLLKKVKELLAYPHQIAYYGSATSEEVKSIINTYHFVPEVFLTPPREMYFKPIAYKRQEVYFAHYDMVQVDMTWVKPTSSYDLKKSPYIRAFNEYFGGGMSSIVFQEIRESRALAYSTYASFSSSMRLDRESRMFAYVGTQADKMADAYAAMSGLLRQLPENEKALQQAISSAVSSIRTNRVSKLNLFFQYRMMQDLQLTQTGDEYAFGVLPRLSMADISIFFKEEVLPGTYVLSVLGNEKQVQMKTLKSWGKVKKVKVDNKLFGY